MISWLFHILLSAKNFQLTDTKRFDELKFRYKRFFFPFFGTNIQRIREKIRYYAQRNGLHMYAKLLQNINANGFHFHEKYWNKLYFSFDYGISQSGFKKKWTILTKFFSSKSEVLFFHTENQKFFPIHVKF